MPHTLPSRRLAAWAALALALPLTLATAARAQTTEERRCTGQWRATPEERITACTALIESGRYQAGNLAILHHNRGLAMRAKGDAGRALDDFTEAISLNAGYARAYADRGSVRLTQHDLDGAIADFDAA